jgi:endonuclease YncB( thermonuclease family)
MSRRKETKKQGSGFLYLILGVIVALAYLNAPNLNLDDLLRDLAIDPGGSFSLPSNRAPADDPFRQDHIITGRVVAIADGDTVTVLDGNQQQHRIRLAGIDAPELGQPFGQAARDTTGTLCFNRLVTVRVQDTDRYGRLVGWIEADGQNVNHRLVHDGLAWHYQQYDKSATLDELENDARANRRGLWSDPRAIPPWEWRKQQRSR